MEQVKVLGTLLCWQEGLLPLPISLSLSCPVSYVVDLSEAPGQLLSLPWAGNRHGAQRRPRLCAC